MADRRSTRKEDKHNKNSDICKVRNAMILEVLATLYVQTVLSIYGDT